MRRQTRAKGEEVEEAAAEADMMVTAVMVAVPEAVEEGMGKKNTV